MPETQRTEEGQIVIVESKAPLTTTNLGYARFGKNTVMAVFAGEPRKNGDFFDIGIAPESADIMGGVMKDIAFEINKSEAAERLKAQKELQTLEQLPTLNDEQKSLLEKHQKMFAELKALKDEGKERPGHPGGDLPGIDNIDPTPVVARNTLVPASHHTLMTAEKFKKVMTNYAAKTKMNIAALSNNAGRDE